MTRELGPNQKARVVGNEHEVRCGVKQVSMVINSTWIARRFGAEQVVFLLYNDASANHQVNSTVTDAIMQLKC